MNIDLNKQFTTLERIGLSEGEANIYTANNSIGPASIIDLAQKSGYSRQQVYELIPRLLERGLLKKVRAGKRVKYEAVKPDVLNELADDVSNEVSELVSVLKSKRAAHKAIPQLTVYENPLAMREWYINFMKEAKEGEEFLVWSAGKDWYEMDTKFIEQFLRVKDEKKMKNYIIAPDNETSRDLAKIISRQGVAKFRFTDNAWSSNVDKWIWRDEVCILTMRANATNMIVIKSADYANLERFNFYRVWETLK
jgi:sugar-specific transcriptional regulator TrmB